MKSIFSSEGFTSSETLTKTLAIHFSTLRSRLLFLGFFRSSKIYEKCIGISALLTIRFEERPPDSSLLPSNFAS